MQLRDKLVLVTGATGGIGAALSELLVAAGARVVLNGLRQQELEALNGRLGGGQLPVLADISTAEGRSQLSEACQQAGGLDVLVNLAGLLDCNLFEKQDDATLQRLLLVNTLGPVLLTRQLLPQLARKAEARIVNVGSTFGSIGHPGFTAYCASKAAIKMFSEALARELADTRISVGYIAPRATDTPLNSAKVLQLNRALGNQMDPPALVARAIFELASNRQRLRFLGFPEALFVRLNALLPGVVHHALVGKLAQIRQIIG